MQAGVDVLVEFEVFGTARFLLVPHHLAGAQHPFQPAIHMQVSWASPPAQGVSSAERVGRRGAWLLAVEMNHRSFPVRLYVLQTVHHI